MLMLSVLRLAVATLDSLSFVKLNLIDDVHVKLSIDEIEVRS